MVPMVNSRTWPLEPCWGNSLNAAGSNCLRSGWPHPRAAVDARQQCQKPCNWTNRCGLTNSAICYRCEFRRSASPRIARPGCDWKTASISITTWGISRGLERTFNIGWSLERVAPWGVWSLVPPPGSAPPETGGLGGHRLSGPAPWQGWSTTPGSSFFPGSIFLSWPVIYSEGSPPGSRRIGRANTAIPSNCWKRLSTAVASRAPVIRRPIGCGSDRPKAGAGKARAACFLHP